MGNASSINCRLAFKSAFPLRLFVFAWFFFEEEMM